MRDHHPFFTIREAVLADYPELPPLSDEVHALHSTAHPDIFRSVGSGNSLPQIYFETQLAQDTSTIQVAEVEGVIAGFAIVDVFDAPPYEIFVPCRTVFINSMVVTAKQRNHGIGRALVEAATEWGRAKGATSLELVVWAFNQDAITFYERLGLTPLNQVMQLELS